MGLARLSGRVGPPIVLLLPAMMLTAALPAPFSAAVPARVDCKSITPAVAARSALASSTGAPASASVRAQFNTPGGTGRTQPDRAIGIERTALGDVAH